MSTITMQFHRLRWWAQGMWEIFCDQNSYALGISSWSEVAIIIKCPYWASLLGQRGGGHIELQVCLKWYFYVVTWVSYVTKISSRHHKQVYLFETVHMSICKSMHGNGPGQCKIREICFMPSYHCLQNKNHCCFNCLIQVSWMNQNL